MRLELISGPFAQANAKSEIDARSNLHHGGGKLCANQHSTLYAHVNPAPLYNKKTVCKSPHVIAIFMVMKLHFYTAQRCTYIKATFAFRRYKRKMRGGHISEIKFRPFLANKTKNDR